MKGCQLSYNRTIWSAARHPYFQGGRIGTVLIGGADRHPEEHRKDPLFAALFAALFYFYFYLFIF
jgi:hypothetical protein